MANLEEAMKAAKEREAAAKDPAFVADPKLQVQSSAATVEGQNSLDAQAAAKAGAPSASRITDSASSLRQMNSDLAVPNPAPLVAIGEPAGVTPDQAAFAVSRNVRTFKHVYAGASAIMADGKKIVFGGGLGGPGYYATHKKEEIDFLEALADTNGSQVSEPEKHLGHPEEFEEARREAAQAARENTVRYQDPRALKAFDNLGDAIARNS